MLSEKCLSKKKNIFEKLATSVIMHKHYLLSSCSFLYVHNFQQMIT